MWIQHISKADCFPRDAVVQAVPGFDVVSSIRWRGRVVSKSCYKGHCREGPLEGLRSIGVAIWVIVSESWGFSQ